MSRAEFLELVIKIGFKKYITSKKLSPIDAVERLISHDLLPHVKTADYSYQGYRYEVVHSSVISKVFENNEWGLRALYGRITPSKEQSPTLKSFINFTQTNKIDILPEEIVKCFALSKMPIITEEAN